MEDGHNRKDTHCQCSKAIFDWIQSNHGPIVYATTPAILQAAIDMAKRYEVGFMMTQPKISNYAETEVTEQLEVLIATVQQLLRKKEKEAYPCQNNRSSNN